ncbi:MAG: thrombospondin type 3 repeat-containing protein [Chloroflexi bacterium]|nr:thrombospondin type 3 repeat-containing protein [Chloroflexota bacterium]
MSRVLALIILIMGVAALVPQDVLSVGSFPDVLNSNATTDDPSASDTYPRLATDGNGNWVTVWQSDDHLDFTTLGYADIFVARSSDDGATWSQATYLNNNAPTVFAIDWDPDIATGNGVWIAVWRSGDAVGGIGGDWDILYSRSLDNGATWSAPRPLNANAASESDGGGKLATDGTGTWIAILGLTGGLHTTRSIDNGANWSTPVQFSPDGGGADIATDGAGTWITEWSSAAAAGPDSDIEFSRSTDAGVTWSDPSLLNINAFTDGTFDNDYDPQVQSGGPGAWLSVWTSTDDQGGTIGVDQDILYTTCDLGIDQDCDGVPTLSDNCPDQLNPDQSEVDGDGVGDVCDADADGDGIPENADGAGEPGDNPCTGGNTVDCDDNCAGLFNASQVDADGDGVGNACDACPQDAADDVDGDGICAGNNPCSGGETANCTDNCPNDANANQADTDGDGIGDACDLD